ncbi:MAG: AMP-binding protein, partial [Gemmatimonadetes bacterium]|nr:AMP-binding protein [Gemmatimonadota bacterium]
PKAIEHRTTSSKARLIVTDSVNRPKLDEVRDCPPVLTISRRNGETVPAGDQDFDQALAQRSTDFAPVMRTGGDACMMLFTSGTTGLAKGVTVPNKALMAIHMYMRYAVDLRDTDTYWNIADPGWAYGLYFGAIGPLLLGHATTLYDGPFSVDAACHVIEKYRISSLAGAPTAYRLLMAAGADAAPRIRGLLRTVSSAGEPLNPEVIRWFRETLDCPIHDHYGQ